MAGINELDLESAVETVMLPKGEFFTVRGLALSDISRLIRVRAHDIEGFFQKFMVEREQVMSSLDPQVASKMSATKFGTDLLTKAPDLAAEIIACASDEPTLAHKVKRMPFPTQLDALEKITALTFIEEEGAKKAIETVMRALKGMTGLVGDLNQQQIGSMLSEGNAVS